ncbi:glycosyltransferase, partial [Candidatus Dojkabacteria bacterium]|nr:glycosyltransferase [Candidatus Dojkabacteria bacterium]
MLWTIILILKNNKGWYTNYIESKLFNQINTLNLEHDIEVVVFEPNLQIFGKYVSVVDNVEISNNFIELIYNKLKNCKKDCIGLKAISYMDNVSLEVDLPISKLNPIRTDIIFKIQNFNYYIHSENLSNLADDLTIDNLNTPIIFYEDLEKQPFSIIISAYNSQKYIEECLDSIENQTYFKDNDNYEILVGVDGCQDTLNKLQEIKHKYRNLHIYMMSENKGTYITCNTLIALVKYENIIRFDSDDVMTHNMINEVARNIQDNDIMILGSLDLTNGVVGTKFLLTEGIIYFRKSVMDNIAGGYQPWICSADTELIKRVVNKAKITQLKKALFHRRLHSESLTQKKGTRYKSELREGYKKMIKPHYKDNEIKIERIINSNIVDVDNVKISKNSEININDYFDHIYCLNLDKRQDKWLIMKKKFDKLNIKAYRFSAIDGETLSDDIVKKYNNLSKGAIGCMLSYYEIINDAKYNGYKKILIFEDDVLFDNKFNINFSNKIQNIKNWKMLHLGASQYNWNNIKYIDNFYY